MNPARLLARLFRLTLLIGLLAATSAQAHKPSDAYLNLHVDAAGAGQPPRITARWDVHLRDLDAAIGLDSNDDGQLTWGEVREHWGAIEAEVWAHLKLDAGRADCVAVAASAPPQLDHHSDGGYAVLQRTWVCHSLPHTLNLSYDLFADIDPTHRGIVNISGGADSGLSAPLSAVLVPDAGPRHFVLGSPTPWQTLREFVVEGVSHIAQGADHILFLLSLLLPAVLVRQADPGRQAAALSGWAGAAAFKPVLLDVLRVVTAFTVAHSITLALAVLGIVNPPSRWVESIIAASVVLAALNNLWPIVREGRWMLTFVFGLVHGFGFAGALKDLGLHDAPLGWALLGFNLGVEAGQLAIVALFVPLAWGLRRRAGYRIVGLQAGSAVIAGLAGVWLVQRAFDVSLGLPG